MEISTVLASDVSFNIDDRVSFEEIVSNSSSEEAAAAAARGSHFEKRKSLDEDALQDLQAIKLDPAVLVAQVTVATDTQEETPHNVVAAVKRKLNAGYPSFEEVVSMQQAALLGLSPQQLELLMAFADTLRRQRQNAQRHMECAFCKNNGSPAAWYSSHALRDRRRVRCPVLRALRCRRCGASGDRAHTDKYCPLNMWDSWSCP